VSVPRTPNFHPDTPRRPAAEVSLSELGQELLHRIPHGGVVAIAVGAALVGGLIGALAHGGNGNNPKPQPSPVIPSPVISPLIPSPVPSFTPLPSPVPSVVPTPLPSIQPSPGQLVAVQTLSLSVPAGWRVSNKSDDFVQVSNGDGDLFVVQHDQFKSPETYEDLNQGYLAYRQKEDPQARQCGGAAAPGATLDGSPAPPAGESFFICYTWTPQNAPAEQDIDRIFLALGSDGVTYWFEEQVVAQSRLSTFAPASGAIAGTIQWRG
jgi:hypothetical protein